MTRSFLVRDSLVLAALAAVLASGCSRETADVPLALEAHDSALTQDHVVAVGPTCDGSGAHAKHGATIGCTTCHVCAGVLQFDPASPAVGVGIPAPSFDATTKTCSSVACHGVAPGTYTYTTWDWGSDSPIEHTVAYGGAPQETPSWYATGLGCAACHGNPPQNYYWHINHGGGKQCELCHPSAVSVNGVGTALNPATNCGPTKTESCASFHANGTVDVTPKWGSTCYGCH